MNAIIYCRVSSDKQAKGEYTSLDVQRHECIQYLAEHFPEAELVEVVSETVSAGEENRPGLARIIRLVEAGAVDVVVVYMWSRLVRDPWDSMYLRRLCQQRRVRIRCAKEDLVNLFLEQMESGDGMQQWMAENMLFHLDQALKMERLQISKRTKENMRRRVLEGRFPGRTVPFGYRLADGGLVPDPETAPLVADAFRLYVETQSPAQVRDYLNLFCEHRRWSVQTVRYLLANPTYKGVLKWGDIQMRGFVPALVDEATWEAAQVVRMTKVRRVSRREDFDWYLRGKVKCACGFQMTGFWVNGKTWTPYYQCQSLRYGYRAQCPVKRVNAHRLHEAVAKAFEAVADEEWLEYLFHEGLAEETEQDEQRHRLEQELARVQRQIDVLLDAVQSEGEARSVVRRIRELEQMERRLREQLLQIGVPATYSLDEIRQSLRQFASAWEYMTEPERHEVVSLGVMRVDVKRRDAYEIHLYVPDLSVERRWLPSRFAAQVSVKVVDLPREGVTVADVQMGGQ